MPAGLEIRRALREDLIGVLAVQHEAFGRVSRELAIEPASLPPLRETVADLERLLDGGTVFVVACDDDQVIGSVRGRLTDGTVHVGRLVVDGRWLRRGVGTDLMAYLERQFCSAERFELFTGADAIAPLALYEALGYVRTHSSVSEGVELVWLAKPGPAGPR